MSIIGLELIVPRLNQSLFLTNKFFEFVQVFEMLFLALERLAGLFL